MLIAPERRKAVFQKTERDLRRLSSDQGPQSVHSYRTTSRRLQTLLETLLSKRDRNQKKLLTMLGRIRKRAGKVRDLDVQLAALRSLKIPQEPRRKTQVIQAILELRAQREKKLRKLLTKGEIREIRRRLKAASKDMKIEEKINPLAVARELLAAVPYPNGPMTDAVLHQYRIVVKRARYAAEFAPKSTESTQFIAELKKLQDALGNWHDWLTLTNSVAERLGEVSQSPLVAALHNVTGGKFRQASAALSASEIGRAAVKGAPPLPQPSRQSTKKSAPRAFQASSAA